jgi:hypothetical protein
MAVQSTNGEQDAVAALTVRLQRLFTDVPPQRVADLVERAHHRFDDSRIRQFIPLLVEHAVRDDLKDLGETTQSSTASDSVLAPVT